MAQCLVENLVVGLFWSRGLPKLPVKCISAINNFFASDLQLGQVQPGCLPEDIPFPDRKFDLIVLLDVLEHLEEDTASLQALATKLKASGWLLVTVPAYAWLWSKQDELL